MAKIEITKLNGESGESLELNDAVFGIEPNTSVIYEVVRAQRLSWRQGTHSTKTRGFVSGGGRKPFRQKGTGRARQGTIRAPQMRGGGVVFGPHPHSHAVRVNKKVVKLAMRSVLSGKLADKELYVIDKFEFDTPSTKQAIQFLKDLKLDGRVTIVVPDDDVNAFLSFRNIQKVNVISAFEINTYELLDNKALILTKPAVEYAEEVLG